MDSLEHSKEAILEFLKQNDDGINRLRETALKALDEGAQGLDRAIVAFDEFQALAEQAQFPVLTECLKDISSVLKAWQGDSLSIAHITDVSDVWADVIYELSNFLVFMADDDPHVLKERVVYRLLQLAKSWTTAASKFAGKTPVPSDGSWGLFEDMAVKLQDSSWGMEAPPAAVATPLKALPDLVPKAQALPKKTEESVPEASLASHYLICMLGSQQYALPIHQVREILERRPEKSLPLQRPGIVGLVTVRGLVCPVVDVSTILYSKEESGIEQDPQKRCMVVCEVDRRTFCFNVDDVKQVASLHEFQDLITPLANEGSGQRAISHVSHFQDKSVLFVKMREVIPA